MKEELEKDTHRWRRGFQLLADSDIRSSFDLQLYTSRSYSVSRLFLLFLPVFLFFLFSYFHPSFFPSAIDHSNRNFLFFLDDRCGKKGEFLFREFLLLRVVFWNSSESDKTTWRSNRAVRRKQRR